MRISYECQIELYNWRWSKIVLVCQWHVPEHTYNIHYTYRTLVPVAYNNHFSYMWKRLLNGKSSIAIEWTWDVNWPNTCNSFREDRIQNEIEKEIKSISKKFEIDEISFWKLLHVRFNWNGRRNEYTMKFFTEILSACICEFFFLYSTLKLDSNWLKKIGRANKVDACHIINNLPGAVAAYTRILFCYP